MIIDGSIISVHLVVVGFVLQSMLLADMLMISTTIVRAGICNQNGRGQQATYHQ